MRLIVPAVAVLLLAACGSTALPPDRPVAAAQTPAPAVAVVTVLPGGFDPPVRLVPNPTGAGVWFWANSAADARVFFQGPGMGTPRSWSLGDPDTLGIHSLAEAGFDVGADGVAWIGAQHTLLRLDTAGGAVRHWTIPAPSDNAAAEKYQPEAGRHVVVGLASDGRGHVAIAQTAAATVTVFDAGSERFSSVSLPTALAPSRLAYLADGTLGVALVNYNSHTADHVVLVATSGQTTVAAVGAQFLHPADGNFLVGAEHLELLSPTGTVQAVPNTAAAMVGMLDAAPLPSGAYVYPTQSGVSVLHSDGTLTAIDLPTFPCGGLVSRVPGQPTPTDAPNPTCPTTPLTFAPDAQGDIWLLYLSAGKRVLGVIAAGSY